MMTWNIPSTNILNRAHASEFDAFSHTPAMNVTVQKYWHITQATYFISAHSHFPKFNQPKGILLDITAIHRSPQTTCEHTLTYTIKAPLNAKLP